MKNLILEITRINELMGTKKNLIMEQRWKFLRSLFGDVGNPFKFVPGQLTNKAITTLPGGKRRETYTLTFPEVRNADGVVTRAERTETITAEPKAKEDLEKFLTGAKKYEELTPQGQQFLWDLERAMDYTAVGGRDRDTALYEDFLDNLSKGDTKYNEEQFLKQVTKDLSVVSASGKGKTLREVLEVLTGNKQLAARMENTVQRRLDLFERKQLKKYEDQVLSELIWPESVQLYNEMRRLPKEDLDKLTAIVDKTGFAKGFESAEKAWTDLQGLFKELETAGPNDRLEEAILLKLRNVYNAGPSMSSKADEFISALEKTGETNLIDLSKKLNDLKLKNGGTFEMIQILPHRKPWHTKVWIATMEALKSSIPIWVRKFGRSGLVKKLEKKLFNLDKDAVKKELEIAKKEIGPQWTNQLTSGSSRGWPFSRGRVEDGIIFLDNYAKLRKLSKGGSSFYPWYSFVVEIFVNSIKYSVYNAIVKTIIRSVQAISFNPIEREDLDCANEVLDFFREKEIYSLNTMEEYLYGKGFSAETPTVTGILKLELPEKINLRKLLEKEKPCVIEHFPVEKTDKIFRLLLALDWANNEGNTGKITAGMGAENFWTEIWEDFTEHAWNMGWLELPLAFTTIDDFKDFIVTCIENYFQRGIGVDEPSLTKVQQSVQKVMGTKEAWETFCLRNTIDDMGFKCPKNLEDTPSGCGSKDGKRKVYNFNLIKEPSTFDWVISNEDCDDKYGQGSCDGGEFKAPNIELPGAKDSLSEPKTDTVSGKPIPDSPIKPQLSPQEIQKKADSLFQRLQKNNQIP